MVLCCVLWCQISGDVSPYVCSYYFSSVRVAEWPLFGKDVRTRLNTYVPFVFLLFVILVISRS